MLTEDQARLLWMRCRGWLLAELIVATEFGISTLKSRAGGGMWPKQFHPELPYNCTGTSKTGIYGYTFEESTQKVIVSVSYTDIRRWAALVPESTKTKIKLTLRAAADERDRYTGWCRCPYGETAPNPNADPCTRYHPTESEVAERRSREDALKRRQDHLTQKALGLLGSEPKQLELFA